MYLRSLLGLIFLARQLSTLVVALQNPLPAGGSAVEEPHDTASSSLPSLLGCSLDMVNLKEVDYNTIFDGSYGSKFENALLTLCSDEGKGIPWKKNSSFEPSVLDQVAERCCSDILQGLDTVSFERRHS